MSVRRTDRTQSWRLAADELTDVRSGAAGVLAARYLAGGSVCKVAILGTGRVAGALVRCLGALLRSGDAGPLASLKSVSVYSQSLERIEAFTRVFARAIDVPLCAADSAERAVAGAGVILLAAASPSPVLQPEHLGAGIHVSVLTGSPTNGALSPECLLCANCVVVDQMAQCLRSGEMMQVRMMGKMDAVRFARWHGEIAHLGHAAIHTLRQAPEEISIAYLSGLALLDLAVAIEMVQAGMGESIGVDEYDGEENRVVRTGSKHGGLALATHTLNINAASYALVAQGNKTLEVRLKKDGVELFATGDIVAIRNRDSGEIVERRINSLTHYASLQSLLEKEDLQANGNPTDPGEFAARMRSFQTAEEEHQFGLVAIHLAGM